VLLFFSAFSGAAGKEAAGASLGLCAAQALRSVQHSPALRGCLHGSFNG